MDSLSNWNEEINITEPAGNHQGTNGSTSGVRLSIPSKDIGLLSQNVLKSFPGVAYHRRK